MRYTMAFLMVALLAGCTAPERAKKVLEDQGYTNVETTGYAWFDCGQDDAFATEFKALSPVGRPVEGAVCSGWFKGNTVRID